MIPVEVAKATSAVVESQFRLQELHEEDPEAVVVALLDSAKNVVWMSTKLHPAFYNRPPVKEAFVNAAGRVTEFHLLLDSRASWNERKRQLPWIADLISNEHFLVEQSKVPIQHWFLIDWNNFRLEKEHSDDSMKTSNLIIWNASLRKDDETVKLLIQTLESKFELWWANGCPVR